MSDIFGPETALTAGVATLRAHLVAEMTIIDASKADGIITIKPTAADILDYMIEPTPLPHKIQIECTTDGFTTLPADWESAEADRGELTTQCAFKVRTTIVERRAGADPRILTAQAIRTMMAAVRVCTIRYWDLGTGGTPIEWCRVVSGVVRNLPGDLMVRQADALFSIRVRERLASF